MAETLYKQLAEQVADQIRNKVYKSGDKLPSVRKMSAQHQVSIATVLACYGQLEDKGFIEVRPKSGYYVKSLGHQDIAVPNIKQSMATPHQVSTSQLVMSVMRDSSHPQYVSLGAAIPSSEFPIINQLKKVFAQVVRSQPFLGIGYDATTGNDLLRRQIAKRAIEAGVSVTQEDIVITAGCQGAIALCLRALCKTGDIVAVETPSYYGLLQLIESLGLKAIEIPSDPRTGMSIEALKLALEQWPIKAVMSVPNFSNPVGSLMPESNKRELVSLINEYDLPFIEDDIYGDLFYGDTRPRAVKAFDTEGRVLLCSSISKVLEPQLGLGWVMPGRYQEEIEYERFLNSTTQFRLPQLAVAEILSKGSFDRHLKQARIAYCQRRDRLFDLISQHFPEGTRLSKPQGGFVAWLQLPGQVDTTQLYMKARQQGIIISPGELFSSNPDKYRHSLRLSYAPEWTRDREEAVRILGILAKDLSLA